MDRTFVYKISENSLELIFDFDEWKIFERQELGKTWTAIFAELGFNLISGFRVDTLVKLRLGGTTIINLPYGKWHSTITKYQINTCIIHSNESKAWVKN